MVDPDWPQPAPQTLAHAREVVGAHLTSAEAPRKMAQFYDPSGKYAGLTFHTLPPAAPPDPDNDDLTAADLLAITLMDVTATPLAVRQLLEEVSPGKSLSRRCAGYRRRWTWPAPARPSSTPR